MNSTNAIHLNAIESIINKILHLGISLITQFIPIPFFYNFQKPVTDEKSGYGNNFISDAIAWDNMQYATYYAKLRVFLSSNTIIKCKFSYNKFIGNNCPNYGPLNNFNWTFNYDLLKIE